MIVDLGTGGGGAVLRVARRDRAALVIGIDTDAAAMREASHRAAASPRRGGLPNAMFLVGELRDLPDEFDGRVDSLRVTLPWGSLLRSVLDAEPGFVRRAARLLRAGGELSVLVSLTDRDRSQARDPLDGPGLLSLVERYEADGFAMRDVRDATVDDVERLGSAWAKRLGIPHRRPASLLTLRKRDRRGGTAQTAAGV